MSIAVFGLRVLFFLGVQSYRYILFIIPINKVSLSNKYNKLSRLDILFLAQGRNSFHPFTSTPQVLRYHNRVFLFNNDGFQKYNENIYITHL